MRTFWPALLTIAGALTWLIGFGVGYSARGERPTPTPIVQEVRVAPDLQFRCVLSPLVVPDFMGVGAHLVVGEMVICGYDLQASNITGPSVQAVLDEGYLVEMYPIGDQPDVLQAVIEAEERKYGGR